MENSKPLATYIEGTGELKLVVLHGLLGSAGDWRGVARMLGSQMKSLLVDLPNHGRSPWMQDMRYETMARAVLKVLTRVEEKPVLLGHSLGGRLAMYLAEHYPARFQGLVIVDIGPGRYGLELDSIFTALARVDLGVKTRQAVREQLSPLIPDSRLLDFLMKNLAGRSGGGFHWRVNLPAISRAYPHLMEPLAFDQPPFPGPVLVLKGAHSPYLPPHQLDLLYQRYPQLQLEVVPAGHWLQWERPKEVARLLQIFVQGVSPNGPFTSASE